MEATSHLLQRDTSDGASYGLHFKGDRQLFALNTVFLVFAVLVVVGRFWIQRSRAPWFGTETALCLGSLLAYIAQSGIVYVMVLQAHVGDPDRTAQEDSEYARMGFAAQFPYAFEMGFIRLSILVFELHLFGVSKWLRRTVYMIMILVILWIIMTVVLALAMCSPIKYNWDPSVQGHCGNTNASFEAIAGSGIVLDVMIFSTPMWTIWNLHTTVSRRIMVTFLFAIGIFDIVCGGMRLDGVTQGVNNDPVLSLTWAIIEPSVAIFVASAPHFNRIYNKIGGVLDITGSSLNAIFENVRLNISTKRRSGEGVKMVEDESESSSRQNDSMELSNAQASTL